MPDDALVSGSDQLPGDPFFDRLAEMLAAFPFFSPLTSEERAQIARLMVLARIEPGEYVFQQGDPGDFMAFVAEGEVDILAQDGETEPVHLVTLGPGYSLGEMALADDGPRTSAARARTAGALALLSRKNFEKIVAENPGVGLRMQQELLRLLSRHVRRMASELAECYHIRR